METDEHSSTQRWERLRQAAERKEFLAAKKGSWVRLEDGAGDDLERRGPLARGWRRLQSVSMVAFNARAYKKLEPPGQPEKSESDNLLAASERDLGLNHPQPKTTSQVQTLPSPQHAAKLTSNNPVPEVAVDVAPNLPRSTETAAQQEDAVHVPTVDKMKKEQQGRCIKYSQKALGFAVCTFIGYTSAVLHSRKDNADATFNTTFKLAIAPFFVAICTDLFSLKTKGKYGGALVFLSSFHLVLMIYIVFISFDMDYAYAIPFLPLVAGASLLQQKIWPEGQQQIISTDEKVSKDLDNIFDLSTLILNWSTFITAILAVFRDVHLIPEPDEQKAFSVVGLLFFLTIVLGLYLMLVTTVRTAVPNLRVKYLDVMLICLLVSTLIAAVITFT